jgi:ubiquinone/menaquinone biosynthesis C-methylase UbiE
MAFYRDHIYPRLVSILGDPKPIHDIRRGMLPLAQGNVLEIGVGPGVNFVHYDPAKVRKLYALEPNPGMIRMAEQQRKRTELNIEFVGLPGESLPLEDNTIDTVVSTFTLCTIPGVSQAIQGIKRVLRAEGRFIFFEHGLSPDPDVQRWQKRTEPLFQWAFEGCHVTRDVPTLIKEGGLKIEHIEMAYLAPFPKSGSYCFWGVARPQPFHLPQQPRGV